MLSGFLCFTAGAITMFAFMLYMIAKLTEDHTKVDSWDFYRDRSK